MACAGLTAKCLLPSRRDTARVLSQFICTTGAVAIACEKSHTSGRPLTTWCQCEWHFLSCSAQGRCDAAAASCPLTRCLATFEPK